MTYPAGWYPDPQGGRRLLWWDGQRWATGPMAPPGWYPGAVEGAPYQWWDGQQWIPSASVATQVGTWSPWSLSPVQTAQRGMQAEERARPWARVGIWVLAFGPLISGLVLAAELRPFWNQMRTFFDSVRAQSHPGPLPVFPHFSPWVTAAQELSALLNLGGLVVLVIWLYRAAVHARGLGYPSAHTPIWAIFGFIVPVVSFWFPYQVCVGCLPPGDGPARRTVLRWWLLYVLGGVTFASMGVIAAFVPGVWVILLIAGGAWAVAEALCGQAMVEVLTTTHRAATADMARTWS